MFDLRPVAYVIGLLVATLGATMFLPMLVDIAEGRGEWHVFLECGVFTVLAGGLTSLACANAVKEGLTLQQTFLLTVGVWAALPLFGGLPFIFGATEASFTDAYFEAMSGLTTTGSTVFTGLDDLPMGLLLWRGILQWLGGIGIIVVAMVFLPELRVGGMQVFRSEAFETMGKILPRATEIASSISTIYVALTLACAVAYLLCGMNAFDATVHALTTLSTGGFSNYDASFGTFQGPAEYVASCFMVAAALPFVRYVQMLNGHYSPFWRDSQIIVFLLTILALVAVMAGTLLMLFPHHPEQAIRESLFNITSIISGTGYASVDYMSWGPFIITMFFFIGLIGGCAGSTTCSVKIFRYQILFASVRVQLKRIRAPHGVFIPRFQGRQVDDETLSSVLAFFAFFVVSLGVLSVGLGMTGLDFITSISGAATALANVGPGLGSEIGPAGNFAGINDAAKWMLAFAMLTGRLEVMAVFALFTPRFWQG
ncbi:potassium transporter TrkH [Salipiger aestuarii]|uniref:Trk system potassium uptake protein n=1 Tax=Salipiger aestuarii TaxID=568098 RepID=A0A327YIK2_9RHOB|nr:TrkH family potassium uptake protein [Salipiger aestuarii]EIE50428.1 Trk system potassium uptake protein [Citreicella sp. 357]KAA8609304.1 potassium transporter TrkH [Salipiger aestuarii]KAA8615159.1 potassium transporter TrkH [Salipiger aestuarii]KAB2542916.1 potassium transporter TrkH [Salipiger aestuarii]RAK20838.1 trk system potassium uptake protein TrkH [Salipiger aestuarii]